MSGRIIQFGTSRFLQAHVDLFVHEARQAGQAAGPITVVQSSGAADRAGRVAAFGQPYPVIIRGVQEGRAVSIPLPSPASTAVCPRAGTGRRLRLSSRSNPSSSSRILATMAMTYRRPTGHPHYWKAASQSPFRRSLLPFFGSAGGRAGTA